MPLQLSTQKADGDLLKGFVRLQAQEPESAVQIVV